MTDAQRIAHIGNWKWNIRTGDVNWSAELYAIYRLDSNTFIPTIRSFAEYVHPDDREFVNGKVEQIISTGLPVNFDFRIIAADGSTRVINTRGEITDFDEQGKSCVMVGINQDITERKQAEEALQKSRDQFTALIQNVNSGVALIDEQGKFLIVNPMFMRLFGLADDPDSILNVNSQDWSAWQVFAEDGTLLHVDDHPIRKAALTGQAVRNKLVGMRLPSGRRSGLDAGQRRADLYSGRQYRVAHLHVPRYYRAQTSRGGVAGE